MYIVPQDRYNLQGPEIQRYPPIITCNTKTEVTLFFFTAPSISAFVNEPPRQPTRVPPYFQDIQHFPSQVWNFDEILFDMNVIWCKMVWTYKLFMGDKVCRSHTCEKSPFCCTAFICTCVNEQCFFSPVWVQQSTHSITRYTVILWYKIDCQYVCIEMGGLNDTYKVGFITILDCY